MHFKILNGNNILYEVQMVCYEFVVYFILINQILYEIKNKQIIRFKLLQIVVIFSLMVLRNSLLNINFL